MRTALFLMVFLSIGEHSSFAETGAYFGFGAMPVEKAAGCIEVARVIEGTPAAAAGLQEGDIIIAVKGETIDCPIQKPRGLFSWARVGEKARFEVVRQGKKLEFEIQAVEIPAWIQQSVADARGIELGEQLLQRLVASGESFEIWLENGQLAIAGSFSTEEAAGLLRHWQTNGTVQSIIQVVGVTEKKQKIRIRADHAARIHHFEPVK